MSLVSSYIVSAEGNLIKNPTLQTAGAFICFDDDDPIELVVPTPPVFNFGHARLLAENALAQLAKHGAKFKITGPGDPFAICGYYGKPTSVPHNQTGPARSWWLELLAPIPEAALHEGEKVKTKPMQGVYHLAPGQEIPKP